MITSSLPTGGADQEVCQQAGQIRMGVLAEREYVAADAHKPIYIYIYIYVCARAKACC